MIIAFVWTFVIIISVLLFWDGKEYIVGGPFIESITLFITAITVSATIAQTKK